MDVLDAVYRSSDRFATPDDRYGYGIPNFRKAYRLIKSKQNLALFGNEWLRATPDPFSTVINTTFVAQRDGLARLELLSSNGVTVATYSLLAEEEEVYQYSFVNLDHLPAGNYSIRYTDSLSTRSINISKKNNRNNNRWMTINEGTVVNKNITVTLVAPESASIALRLINTAGIRVAEKQLSVTAGQVYSIAFLIQNLTKGAYYIQYTSKTQRQLIRLIKL
jgi:hypothetical protein